MRIVVKYSRSVAWVAEKTQNVTLGPRLQVQCLDLFVFILERWVIFQ
jgi:hypothetical protein